MATQAYLFDLDGTLAASEPLKGRALAAACGDRVDPAIYAAVMGRSWDVVRGHFLTAAGLTPDLDAFDAEFRAAYLALLDAEVTAIDGAPEFLAQAATQGLKIGLVSSAAPWMVERVLARLACPPFDLVVTQADVARHKPDPEAYQLALDRLGLAPDEALVFEDSEAGLQAATAAGCRCVAIRHGLNGGHDFGRAVRVIANFREMMAGIAE